MELGLEATWYSLNVRRRKTIFLTNVVKLEFAFEFLGYAIQRPHLLNEIRKFFPLAVEKSSQNTNGHFCMCFLFNLNAEEYIRPITITLGTTTIVCGVEGTKKE